MRMFTYTAKASREFYIYAETKDEAQKILDRTGIYLDIKADPKDEGSVGVDETYGTDVEFYMSEEIK